nr:helix-turn-helix transcriptional regulator [Kibdelosporangium sp. MJ126-NF4]CEL20366.1 hypothetical protein [Kibdelosporangium sp. MJ126-NF4]CTQ97591.1 putative membrane protein [Kibdelosporangium sp. MJ126-NF4]
MTDLLGERLRELRHQAGLSQEQLAERAGLSVRVIRRLETGDGASPRPETVRQLVEALRLSPDQLVHVLGLFDRGADAPPAPRTLAGLPESLATATDELASAVAARWRREEEHLGVHDPHPLPVRWQAAPELLTDHWANISRAAAGVSAGPVDLTGRIDQVTALYRKIPSGRLVVLGRAGAGKSVLAMRLTLDLLATRAEGEAVPVIFDAGWWDPARMSTRDWLSSRLEHDHPALAGKGSSGRSLAAELVDAGAVLPVIDGFDEIADPVRAQALRALNDTNLPLVLVSRRDEYAATAAKTDVLTAAAAIELTDITLADLSAYLPGTARRAQAWDPVLGRLGAPPRDPVITALGTPRMVALARTVHGSPGNDPVELLDDVEFDTPEAVENHLLDSLIPAVYPRKGEGRWDSAHAWRWLSYLAGIMDRRGTRDLPWWRLGRTLFAFTAFLEAPMDMASASPTSLVSIARRTAAIQASLVGLVIGLAVGFAYGIGYGFVAAVVGGLGFAAVMTTWGRWVLARCWLALTGRLPWALLAFLDDARQRGVLNQRGASYRFRHSRLQHRLARTHASRPRRHLRTRYAGP